MTNVYKMKPSVVNGKMVGGKYDGLPTYRVPDSYLEEFGFIGDGEKKVEEDLGADLGAAVPLPPPSPTPVTAAEVVVDTVTEAAVAGQVPAADPVPESPTVVE